MGGVSFEIYDKLKAENERLRAALTKVRGPSDVEKCPKCGSLAWPSVNWKNGKSYAYCAECGYVEHDPEQETR